MRWVCNGLVLPACHELNQWQLLVLCLVIMYCCVNHTTPALNPNVALLINMHACYHSLDLSTFSAVGRWLLCSRSHCHSLCVLAQSQSAITEAAAAGKAEGRG